MVEEAEVLHEVVDAAIEMVPALPFHSRQEQLVGESYLGDREEVLAGHHQHQEHSVGEVAAVVHQSCGQVVPESVDQWDEEHKNLLAAEKNQS